MRSNLITIAIATCMTLGTTAAFADNNWAFDDAYWKQPAMAASAPAAQSDDIRGPYDQVDRYNP